MTYETYRYIFLGGAALAGVMLLCSVMLFVFLKIPQVVNDLTGKTARRAIENIRSQNESTGNKTYKTSAVNLERGRKTDRIGPSGSLLSGAEANTLTGAVTSKIYTQELEDGLSVDESGAAALADSGNTTVLYGDISDTTVLYGGGSDTTVLYGGGSDTTVLYESSDGRAVLQEATKNKCFGPDIFYFEIEYEITYIHTSEVITP